MKQGEHHEPTPEITALVEEYSGVGISQEQICSLIDMSLKTLRKYYTVAMLKGKAKANKEIGGKLYRQAMEGNVTSLIWWTKSQMKWSGEVENQTIINNITLPDEKIGEVLKRLMEKDDC